MKSMYYHHQRPPLLGKMCLHFGNRFLEILVIRPNGIWQISTAQCVMLYNILLRANWLNDIVVKVLYLANLLLEPNLHKTIRDVLTAWWNNHYNTWVTNWVKCTDTLSNGRSSPINELSNSDIYKNAKFCQKQQQQQQKQKTIQTTKGSLFHQMWEWTLFFHLNFSAFNQTLQITHLFHFKVHFIN
jgi:hypothetical protein